MRGFTLACFSLTHVPSCGLVSVAPSSDTPVVSHGEVNESDSGDDIEAQIAALMKKKALLKG